VAPVVITSLDKENAALRDALSRLEDAADVAAALVAIAQPVLRRSAAWPDERSRC